MTGKIAARLLQAGGFLFVAALLCMFVAGLAAGFGWDQPGATALTICTLAWYGSMLILLLGFVLDHMADMRAMERRSRCRPPTIPLEPREKPEGYNRAVLGWLHEGTELRQPGDDFAKGFAARAMVPPKGDHYR